jgi:hypothetical protein
MACSCGARGPVNLKRRGTGRDAIKKMVQCEVTHIARTAPALTSSKHRGQRVGARDAQDQLFRHCRRRLDPGWRWRMDGLDAHSRSEARLPIVLWKYPEWPQSLRAADAAGSPGSFWPSITPLSILAGSGYSKLALGFALQNAASCQLPGIAHAFTLSPSARRPRRPDRRSECRCSFLGPPSAGVGSDTGYGFKLP